jgi:hypothetical protein
VGLNVCCDPSSGRLETRGSGFLLSKKEIGHANHRKDPCFGSYRPWNKGKLVGQKPPLQPKHVWAIRTRLQLSKRRRDLALFNLAIDSKLRGCDLVSLKVEDVAPMGVQRSVRQFVRRRRTSLSASNSRSRRAKRSMITFRKICKDQASTFSPDDPGSDVLPRGSTRDWYHIGSPASAWTP